LLLVALEVLMFRTVLLAGSLAVMAACNEPTDVDSASLTALEGELSPTLQGVWTLVEVEIQGGDNPRIVSGSQIQPSLLIYTDQYVSWAFVLGTEPRPLLGYDASDEELGAAARRYASASGTYERDGSTLRYYRTVALSPNAMLPENQPYVRELVSLSMYRLQTSSLPNADGVTVILRYNRVE